LHQFLSKILENGNQHGFSLSSPGSQITSPPPISNTEFWNRKLLWK
jgi:hypothetical protein